MLQVQAEIVDRKFSGAAQELRLAAPALAAQLNPGQPVLVRSGWGRDPFLRRAFYPIAISGEGFTLRLLPGGDLGQAWLAAAPAGTEVDCLGPVGFGFGIPPGTRNLLCLGEEAAAWMLLPLVAQAVEPPGADGRPGGLVVTLAVEALGSRDLLPASRLPPTVEYHLATLDGSQGRRGRLGGLLNELLAWADVVCAAGSLAFYDRLHAAVQAARYNPPRGFCQVHHAGQILCGVGSCQACRVDLATGRRRACLRGPVFDLLDLRRAI
jgi:dihydroorotate dehydrogenase electron transfer subunit